MPVSTDGVILGAWANLTQARSILDIGAGSGLLSLMAAQRSQAKITAVELEQSAYEACKINATNSPWHSRIHVLHHDITHYALTNSTQFDHIICNPPYFDNGPEAQSKQRSLARHTSSLSFDSLANSISKLINKSGEASLILPSQSLNKFFQSIAINNLMVIRQQAVISVEGKQANRALLAISHRNNQRTNTNTEACSYGVVDNTISLPPLVIRHKNQQYTEQMISLTREFYLKML